MTESATAMTKPRPQRVGFVVMDSHGMPVHSCGGRRAVLYQHAANARRFAREYCSAKTAIYRCVINPCDVDAAMIGYVLIRNEAPVRVGTPKNSAVRLMSTLGGAQRAAGRNAGAAVHRVYIG